jgi:hypothetical protein
VNGGDRRGKVAFLLLALAAVMAVASAAFAVQITLSPSNVDQLGGTPIVDVNCPAAGDPCQINRVKWELTSSLKVDKVKVQWQTASTSGSYTVCVTLFNNDSPTPSAISSGCETQTASSSPVTTTVDVSPNADPAEVYKVQIVIMQN